MSLSLQFSTHFYLASRMHAFLMTCTFGYVFLLSSAHKRRKFFLRTLVRLVKVAYANNSTLSQTSVSAPAWFCRSVWVRQICAAPCRVTLSMNFWRRERFAEFHANSFTKNYFDATWLPSKFSFFLLSFTPEIWRFRVYGCVLAHALCNAG